MRNVLPLKSKLSGQFQRFNAIDGSIEMLKWKIVKDFAGPKQWAVSRKLFHLRPTQPPPDKILLRLWKKSSYGDIQKYTDICFYTANSKFSRRQIFSLRFSKWDTYYSLWDKRHPKTTLNVSYFEKAMSHWEYI